MKTKVLLAGVVTSVVIGAPATERLHAQGPSIPARPGFYISEFEITDREGMKPYRARVASTFEPYGGRYIVRGGKITMLEGEPPKGIVVIAFDSVEKAQA
jgi:Domain of unknown function (DUF1330)